MYLASKFRLGIFLYFFFGDGRFDSGHSVRFPTVPGKEKDKNTALFVKIPAAP